MSYVEFVEQFKAGFEAEKAKHTEAIAELDKKLEMLVNMSAVIDADMQAAAEKDLGQLIAEAKAPLEAKIAELEAKLAEVPPVVDVEAIKAEGVKEGKKLVLENIKLAEIDNAKLIADLEAELAPVVEVPVETPVEEPAQI